MKRQLRICPDLALFYQLAKLQFFFSVKPWLGAIDHHQLSSKRRTNNLGKKVEMDIYSQTSFQLRIASQFLAIFSCFAEIMLWVLNLLSEIWFNFLCFLTTSMYNYWNWHMKINSTVHWFNENFNFFFLRIKMGKIDFRSWQDSNLQSSDPKSDALSIRPHDPYILLQFIS